MRNGNRVKLPAMRGKALHKYITEQVAAVLVSAGYEVKAEHGIRLGDGRKDYVDLLAMPTQAIERWGCVGCVERSDDAPLVQNSTSADSKAKVRHRRKRPRLDAAYGPMLGRDLSSCTGDGEFAVEIETTPRHGLKNAIMADELGIKLWIVTPSKKVSSGIIKKLKGAKFYSKGLVRVMTLGQFVQIGKEIK